LHVYLAAAPNRAYFVVLWFATIDFGKSLEELGCRDREEGRGFGKSDLGQTANANICDWEWVGPTCIKHRRRIVISVFGKGRIRSLTMQTLDWFAWLGFYRCLSDDKKCMLNFSSQDELSSQHNIFIADRRPFKSFAKALRTFRLCLQCL